VIRSEQLRRLDLDLFGGIDWVAAPHPQRPCVSTTKARAHRSHRSPPSPPSGRNHRLVSQAVPHLCRYPCRRPPSVLAGTGFIYIPLHRGGAKTPTGAPRGHCSRDLLCRIASRNWPKSSSSVLRNRVAGSRAPCSRRVRIVFMSGGYRYESTAVPAIRPFTRFWEIPDAVTKLEPLQQVCRHAIATYGDFLIVLKQENYTAAARE
jgi:hypothetical protein